MINCFLFSYLIRLSKTILKHLNPFSFAKRAASGSKSKTSLSILSFDEVETYGKDKVTECILAIAGGQYQDVNVVDKEINFVSTLIKIKRILGE